MAKTLKIELPDHVHSDLEERAKKAGTTTERHAVEFIQKSLSEIEKPQQSVAELRQQLIVAIIKAR